MKRFWYLAGGIIILAALTGVFLLLRPKPFIPKNIQQATTSAIFLPKISQATNQTGTVEYNSNLKLLSYKSTIFGVTSIISEQPTPQNFIDIPQVYDKVLDSWNQYETFDTSQGTVYLTRPDGPTGKEVGVMNSKGTLMFVKPDKNLTDDQWRQLFNSLQILS